ncbi:prepilin-type N-terminal cleavage/methylation domain-containing protein [Thermoanaerobacterium sp. R66]|uniref:competence type IV pilus major pilin ComGC n=1 Tax=Thermoanaerobacterium sp. R66 TaxID=2742479 RepID=UPI002380071A|nr:prepilin-type N-terminal cleavage/methylation domain-containing protein [Thermoanaerobacterium sp. R66]MDE4541671.1 prepilin-type N-terminal cleavage/methylation domain-containing protein [Thermoanaerobacterium sp. R66]
MAWFVKALNKDEKGFTLIELIVVIAILGILAAIAVPNVTKIFNNSKSKADISNAAVIGHAAETYYIDQTTNNANPNLNITPDDLVNGGYLNKAPKDQYGGDFKITFGEDGSVTVTDSKDNQLYPTSQNAASK